MNWYIGQPIVAIRNSFDRDVIKGREYTILQIVNSPCKCKELCFDVGIRLENSMRACADCGQRFYNTSGFSHKGESMFAPLDQDISELTEILETKQPFEV